MQELRLLNEAICDTDGDVSISIIGFFGVLSTAEIALVETLDRSARAKAAIFVLRGRSSRSRSNHLHRAAKRPLRPDRERPLHLPNLGDRHRRPHRADPSPRSVLSDPIPSARFTFQTAAIGTVARIALIPDATSNSRVLLATLLLEGVQTPNCIRQTVFDAVSLDYHNVTVIVDATAAATPQIHLENIRDMKNIGVAAPTLQEWLQL
ncbi:putative inactive nicotinamidase [Canna indica]|uniref:Inactive nicotinamidase n=1 Tax=Canna indica TaxID=4628 RepID=A0AAQ3QHF4_9LILI|nr:putative inactive nicotinamidase [Canna indica]